MALEGLLQDMPLVDLLRVFRMGQKSGVLFVKHTDNEHGVAYVFDGTLIDAVVLDATTRFVHLQAEAALLYMLQWEQAAFTFRHDLSVEQRPARIVRDLEWFIGQAEQSDQARTECRFEQDALVVLAETPPDDHLVSYLSFMHWRLLAAVATGKRVGDLVIHLGISAVQLQALLDELTQRELVIIKREPQTILQPVPLVATEYGHYAQRTLRASPQAGQASLPNRGLLAAVIRRVRGL